jgi:hypothetical protein
MDRERKRKRHESDVPNHSRSRGKHRVLHMHSTKSPARNLLEISGEEYFYTEQYFTQACTRGDRRTSQSPSKRYCSEKGLGAMAISEVRSVPFRAQHEEIPSWIPYSNQ